MENPVSPTASPTSCMCGAMEHLRQFFQKYNHKDLNSADHHNPCYSNNVHANKFF